MKNQEKITLNGKEGQLDIRKTFRLFNVNLFKKLCPTFIRPRLDFASSVWNTLSKREIRKIEGVQTRATDMDSGIPGVRI